MSTRNTPQISPHGSRPQPVTALAGVSSHPSLTSLIHASVPSIQKSRIIEPVCCGQCDGETNNAWHYKGSRWKRGRLRHARNATDLARDTTFLIASSARPRDDGAINFQMLSDSITSVRSQLQLSGSHALVIFDGLAGKPGVSRGMLSRYAVKIGRALISFPDVDALVCEDWQHQANGIRCALAHVPRTPLLFVIQDDTQLGPGGVDTVLVHQLLMQSASVEYIRFALHADCADSNGKLFASYPPCDPHPDAAGLLHRTYRWLDRPHFARISHYDQRLFATLPLDAKVTPEQVLDQRSRVDKTWPLWMYGRRGDMLRDLHWPQLVDGKLVSKEYLAMHIATGKNVTPSYAHSYLIHAYRGRTQDVGQQQISKRQFRSHNPLAWVESDRLTEADS